MCIDRKLIHLLVLALVLIILSSCKPSNFSQADCEFAVPQGMDVECGFLTVPENWANPEGNKIQLHVAIIHTQNKHPQADPILFLDGGPGGFTLDYIQYLASQFNFARASRDVIFFDQRGVGYSTPSLNCPEAEEQWYLDWTQDLRMSEANANYFQALKTCRARLQAQGIDLSGYTSAASAADVDSLRKALGISHWNLYGSSYGTRLALTVMRDFPEGVRSVVLDSSLPIQVNLFETIALNSERTLELVFTRCAADPVCLKDYPDLEDSFYDLVDQLDVQPLTFDIYRASTGKFYKVVLNGDRFIWLTFRMLYMGDQFSTLPWRVESMLAGNTGGLGEYLQYFIFFDDVWNEGMFYSLHCYEEVPFFSQEAWEQNNTSVNSRWAEAFGKGEAAEGCTAWGLGDPPPMENQPVSSDIPTLILAGEFDPITPPTWGRLVTESVSNSQLVEFSTFGHGVLGSGSDRGACSFSIVKAFLDEPGSKINAACAQDFKLSFRRK